MGLKKTLVKFKAEWVDGGYNGGEMFVLLIDTNISLSQLVEKLYAKLKIESSLGLTIHALSTDSTRQRYQVVDDDDLIFAKEDHGDHMYLFVDTIAKDKELSVQVNGSTHLIDGSVANMDDTIATSKFPNAFFDPTEPNVHDQVEERENNGEGADRLQAEHDQDEIPNLDDLEDFPDVSSESDEEEPVQVAMPDEPTWVLPGASCYSFRQEIIYALSAPMRSNPLEKGERFRKKRDMKIAVRKYALENKFTAKIISSNNSRFEVECSDVTCSFAFRARRGSGASMWHVTDFTSKHSCVPDTHASYYRPVKSDLIGNLYSTRVTVADYRPKHVQNEVEDRYQVKIEYNKAWRAVQHALRFAYGDGIESYQILPAYFKQLEASNPGTIASIHTRPDNTFLYSFFALGASIRGFLSYVRPVIAVDATHTKGEYKGIIITALAQDGNGGIYPIAFGFADVEENASWCWFFSKLRKAIGKPDNLVIVSDRHKSIFAATRHVYPGVPHVICYYHLANNLKSHGSKRGNAGRLLHAACYAHSREECDLLLDDIRVVSPGMFAELKKIGKKRWARSYCPSRRYAMLTSNIAESTNAAMKKARRLPITAANEFLRGLIQRWFCERREAAQKLVTTVTPGAASHINELEKDVIGSTALPILEGRRHQVTHGEDVHVVDFESNECTCKAWQLDRLPCLHAVAAARLMRVHPHTLCHEYYSKEWWRESYEHPINPVPHKRTWPPSMKVVLPPKQKRQSGRPKEKRIPSRGEKVRTKTCGRCGEKGHTILTCRNPIRRRSGNDSTSRQDDLDGMPAASGEEIEPVRKRRRPVHCGFCQQEGHTIRKCPNKVLQVQDSEDTSDSTSSSKDMTHAKDPTDDSSSDELPSNLEALSSDSDLF